MERKNVSAILVDDFEDFLKKNGLYQKYISGELLCDQCRTVITSDNIAMIFYKDGYRFCCDKTECLEKIQKG
jgi:hypothetical protein